MSLRSCGLRAARVAVERKPEVSWHLPSALSPLLKNEPERRSFSCQILNIVHFLLEPTMQTTFRMDGLTGSERGHHRQARCGRFAAVSVAAGAPAHPDPALAVDLSCATRRSHRVRRRDDVVRCGQDRRGARPRDRRHARVRQRTHLEAPARDFSHSRHRLGIDATMLGRRPSNGGHFDNFGIMETYR
ncbi:hypothetical protein ABIF29_003348 [Bradyrhizobium elkanii]|uniref:Uncharacterized protein n=1 Tax=Bradyrhizobium elkanii TaxID=29448 RepID=A0ABV4F0B1_BRAEL